MNHILFILPLIFFLTCCAPVQQVGALPDATAILTILPEATAAFIPPSPTSITPTQILCDPFTAGFCITDGHFILQRPILPPANISVDRTYPYASTANGTRDPHHGVEFETDFGTPVHAAADGVILFAGADDEAIYSLWKNYYGNLVLIQHHNDLFTLYAHLSKVDVKAGDIINAGAKIGEVGQSGVAIGSHLHFEVRRGDVEDYSSTVNPELWLVPANAEFGALAMTIVDDLSNPQRDAITLQYYPEPARSTTRNYYFETYPPGLSGDGENAAIGDLPSGRYRITLIHNGHLYERWVVVESGKLAQVVIVVK